MKPKHKINVRSVIAHIVLILLSFLCLFFFVILIINATRSHAQLQKGFSFIPGGHFLDNLKSVANDGSFPMFRGIVNVPWYFEQFDRIRVFSSIMYLFFSSDSIWTLCLRFQIKESCIYIYHGDTGYADTGYCDGLPAFNNKDGNV